MPTFALGRKCHAQDVSPHCFTVKNHAAFWLPEIEIEDEEKSVKYVVDGTYDGKSFLHNKLKRIIDNVVNNLKMANNDITGQEGEDNE